MLISFPIRRNEMVFGLFRLLYLEVSVVWRFLEYVKSVEISGACTLVISGRPDFKVKHTKQAY